MTETEIYEQLSKLVKERKGVSFTVTPSLSIGEDIEWDSVELMDFIISVEDVFRLEISDDEIDRFQTLQDVVVYLSERLI